MPDAPAHTDGAREAERNRRLRRGDWRFLLPDPAPECALSLVDGALHDAASSIAGRIHGAGAAAVDGCDLVVASNPDPAMTRRALRALRPGGAFYSEWTGATALSAARVRRSLARGGAPAARLYWPWPWPSVRPTRYWLPLESSGALTLLRSSAAPARQPILRAGGHWLNACERLLLGGSIRYPLAAVVVKDAGHAEVPGRAGPPARSGDPRSPIPREIALAARQAGCLPAHAPVSWLLLTPGPRTISKVVGLLFAGSPERATCAVKMARVAEAEAGLEREADSLRELRALVPAAAHAAPDLLFTVRTRAGLAIGESARPGRPLWREADRGNARAIAFRVTDWLTGMVHGRPAQARWQDDLMESTIEEFVTQFGAVADPDLLQRTRVLLRALPPLPATLEHRDLGPWNILVEEERLAILDWESSERDGLPALDLLYFLAYLAFFVEDAVRNGRTLPTFRAALDPATPAGGMRAECLARYAARIGLPAGSLPALRLLVWMIHSRSDYRHMTADVGGRPSPELLRGSFFLRLWTEEARTLALAADVRGSVQEVRSA